MQSRADKAAGRMNRLSENTYKGQTGPSRWSRSALGRLETCPARTSSHCWPPPETCAQSSHPERHAAATLQPWHEGRGHLLNNMF